MDFEEYLLEDMTAEEIDELTEALILLYADETDE